MAQIRPQKYCVQIQLFAIALDTITQSTCMYTTWITFASRIICGIAPRQPRSQRECLTRIIRQLWLYLSQFKINYAIATYITVLSSCDSVRGYLCRDISGRSSVRSSPKSTQLTSHLQPGKLGTRQHSNTTSLASPPSSRSANCQVKIVHGQSNNKQNLPSSIARV